MSVIDININMNINIDVFSRKRITVRCFNFPKKYGIGRFARLTIEKIVIAKSNNDKSRGYTKY